MSTYLYLLSTSTLTDMALQNEYAQIMHKRVAEQKSKQVEARKRRASSMRK